MDATKKPRRTKKTVIIPPTGISKNGKSIYITSHLHGIPEEKIRVDLDETELTISASRENDQVMRKITVPAGSWISKKRFYGGILEIILELPL